MVTANSPLRHRAAIAGLLFLSACAPAAQPVSPARGPLAGVERDYQAARFWDDRIRLAESLGADSTLEGIPVAAARDSLQATSGSFRARLTESSALRLTAGDSSARATLAASALAAAPKTTGNTASSDTTSTSTCEYEAAAVAARPDGLRRLTDIVFGCYGNAARVIVVAGDTLNRLGILGLLGRTEDPRQRERLWRALEPVWRSVNGDNGVHSPYRELLRLRRSEWGDSGSPIEAKGPAFGLKSRELDQWLVTALEQWRSLTPDTLLEPWDWYYLMGEASRRLSPRIPGLADLRRVNQDYYRQLGADPGRLKVRYDLEARPGKYPVAYTDFGSHVRWAGRELLPAEPWVFTSYLSGGFDNLAELLHETGHAIHIAAIHTRPAYDDWPDNDTFTEALADLPAMELYEPVWQLRFLGDSAPLKASLRAKYSGIMFDMAWALFELRVHRDPNADPNAIWTAITRDYLGIKPHPDWSWWAMRGQLVDGPGYLVNYALGAFLVADMREAIRSLRGPNAWSAPGLYPWLSARIYRFGLERPSREVLEQLLGRPLEPVALLTDLHRVQQ